MSCGQRVVALAARLLVAAAVLGCGPPVVPPNVGPGDPLAGDPIDPETEVAAEIPPGAPWIRPGPDDELGTSDDVIDPSVIGDVDLVVRAAAGIAGVEFLPPTPLRGAIPAVVAAAFGAGSPVPFMLAFSTGDLRPVAPAFIEGLPFLVLAFPDLDDDGYVGVTLLDGDASDSALETLELYPVGRRYAVARHTHAEGDLSVAVGAPRGMKLALAAAAIAGPFENPNLPCVGCHSWVGGPAADRLFLPFIGGGDVQPDGPVVMTQLPFLPDTDLNYLSAPRGLVPAHPAARVGVQIEIGRAPDPADPRVGEAFTLHLDGSSSSIDVIEAFSGPPRRFGLTVAVDPPSFVPTTGRSVRPGADDTGRSRPVEVLDRFSLPSAIELRAVMLDELGNVAHPISAATVDVSVSGDVRIASPDADGDPQRESVRVWRASGEPLRLEPLRSGATGIVLLEGLGGVSRIDVGEVSSRSLPSNVLIPPDGPPDDDDDD